MVTAHVYAAFFTVVFLVVVVYVVAMLTVRPAKPRGLYVFHIRKASGAMADVLTYRVGVAAPVDNDVVARKLTVTVNGDVRPVVEFAGDATDLGTVDVPQDAVVVLSLVDVDDAGNVSTPAVLEFQAADTVPPQQPGAFTVALVGERKDSDAASN